MITIRRALLSVSDKTGLLDLAHELSARNVELIASGGTAKSLRDAGLPVTLVEEWTGHPEALEGRIKTVHPRIHGGILVRRDHAGDIADMERLGLGPIDLVVVNFYPFQQTLASGKSHEQVIEAIDVGGPSMVRAACKNADYVVVLTSPQQYGGFLASYGENRGQVTREFARSCAAHAFTALVTYDSSIAEWMNGGAFRPFPLEAMRPLRYGENPHQSAWLARDTRLPVHGLIAADQVSGKELSYNNFLDADGALRLLAEFEGTAAVIIKHVTPCGVGEAATVAASLDRALKTDRVSAFGGIVAVNREFDLAAATVLSDIFLEIILAPSFTSEARAMLSKKKALRLIEFDWQALRATAESTQLRSVWGGYLVQTPDNDLTELSELRTVTARSPVPRESAALALAWKVCKHVRSNAIVFADEHGTLAIGAGQMSRVDSADLAVRKAAASGLSLAGSACASDAFFPFRDGLDIAARAGATSVIQPGGSVRDDEVIAAADEQNIAMVFTGRRHFKH